MSTETGISRRLFVAFAVIAIAFIASGAYANWVSVRIDAESDALVTNAMPSIDHLGAALSAVSRLEVATEEYVALDASERPAGRAHVEELQSRRDAELAKYKALPTYPGEDALYQDEPNNMRALDSAVRHVLAAGDSEDAPGGHAAIERELRPRANQSSGLLRQLIRLNAAQASDGIARIRSTRRSVATAAFVLNGITLALTVLMAVWLWRMFLSSSRLQADHARLSERRAQELEAFGSRVAHDMLSPLSSLTFCLGAFRAPSERDPKLQDAMRRSLQCIARARELVNGLFDFARAGGEPEPDGQADVADVVHQVLEEARASELADDTEIDIAPVPSCVARCTPGVLASILGNLVRNALRYTRDAAVRRVAIRVLPAAGYVRVEVEDTGPGIAPGFERVIFEPYTRGPSSQDGGLGLGLATVKRLCEAHGGNVGVRPAPTGGSIFAFTLPIHADVIEVGGVSRAAS